MVTNYYLKDTVCEHCGRGAARGLHIGKSSAAWVFSLRVYNSDDHQLLEVKRSPAMPAEWVPLGAIRSLADWIPLFERFGVIDDHGRDVSAADMITCITQRDHPNGLQHNRSSTGLTYEPVPGTTYDLVTGEFS